MYGFKISLSCIQFLPLTRQQYICQIIDYFLQRMEAYVEDTKSWMWGIEDDSISDEIVFITSKDMSTITCGATRPAKAFTSPFLGETIEQVSDWFVANIRPIDDGYTGFSFLVMDLKITHASSCAHCLTSYKRSDATLTWLNCR